MSTGNGLKGFVAEVRDHKGSKWKDGRVKLRIYGKHDNEQEIKDDDLPWGTPLQDVTSAATNRVGTAPVGMLPGSRVFGVFLDDEEQYPLILGTFARAGKLKQEDENTGGFDDIDNKHSDVPLAAMGKKKSNTRAKKTIEKQDEKASKEAKYNKKEYTSEDDAEDPLDKSRSKNAKKTGDLKTVGSLDKDDNSPILQKILKVDNQNESGALPMAPNMFQQILQTGNMTGGGGIGGMTGGALGGSLGGLAGGFGPGMILGQLSGMLGVDISMLSGMSGMLGGGGGGGGQGGGGAAGIGSSGYIPSDYQGYVPLTPNDISVTAAELLNMLGGYKTPTNEIAGMSAEDKQALYLALIHLMNSVGNDLNCNTYITVTESSLVTIDRYPGDPIFTLSQTDPTVTYQITLPGQYVDDISQVPNGYVPVFYFTDTDPYPGYMEWLGPNDENLFCPRPANRPYCATPEEDAINAAILAIINDLLELVKQGKLTLTKMTELTQTARETAQMQGMENSHGKGNSNMNNFMGMIQQLLGLLGSLIQQAQQNHVNDQDSVLEKGKMNKSLENYSKKAADLRKKKKMAKQAVEQKNQNSGLNGNGLMGFGGMGNKGGGSPGNGNGGSPSPGAQNSNVVTYVSKSGNNVSVRTEPRTTKDSVNFGYFSITTNE